MRKKFLLFLIVTSVLVTVIWLDNSARWLLDEGFILARQIERKIRRELGLPLRGTPNLANLQNRLAQKGVALGDPIFMRIFKRESELELWVKKDDGFVLFETYPICRWSGYLGPKLKEGDRQSPEGFYTVAKGQLNPNSRYHRSFNLGFPNLFDKAHERTGSFLMVHGGCASIGCYAMTDGVITELWQFVTEALDNGQPRFHVHVFPFRMTSWNLSLYAYHPWMEFWQNLKKGHDLFEAHQRPPQVHICDKQYRVSAADPDSNGSSKISKNCAPVVSAAN